MTLFSGHNEKRKVKGLAISPCMSGLRMEVWLRSSYSLALEGRKCFASRLADLFTYFVLVFSVFVCLFVFCLCLEERQHRRILSHSAFQYKWSKTEITTNKRMSGFQTII